MIDTALVAVPHESRQSKPEANELAFVHRCGLAGVECYAMIRYFTFRRAVYGFEQSLPVTFSTALLDTSLMMSLGRTTTSISACYGVREKQARKHPRNHDTAGFCHFLLRI